MPPARQPREESVLINVYDLAPSNDYTTPLGFGFFHTGVEVHGVEWTFGSGGGIMNHRPRQPPMGTAPGEATPFRCSIKVGTCLMMSRDVEGVVASLRAEWSGDRYHILRYNCNAFADVLVQRLCGTRIPAWVNRAAAMGTSVECLLPAHLRAGGGGGSGGGGGGGGGSAGRASDAGAKGSATRDAAAPKMPASGGQTLGGAATTAGADERALRAEAALRRFQAADPVAGEGAKFIPK
jgi:hypothetical protein